MTDNNYSSLRIAQATSDTTSRSTELQKNDYRQKTTEVTEKYGEYAEYNKEDKYAR